MTILENVEHICDSASEIKDQTETEELKTKCQNSSILGK
jgi:hypothetical protein